MLEFKVCVSSACEKSIDDQCIRSNMQPNINEIKSSADESISYNINTRPVGYNLIMYRLQDEKSVNIFCCCGPSLWHSCNVGAPFSRSMQILAFYFSTPNLHIRIKHNSVVFARQDGIPKRTSVLQ